MCVHICVYVCSYICVCMQLDTVLKALRNPIVLDCAHTLETALCALVGLISHKQTLDEVIAMGVDKVAAMLMETEKENAPPPSPNTHTHCYRQFPITTFNTLHHRQFRSPLFIPITTVNSLHYR